MKKFENYKQYGIFMLWLMHVSAFVGIHLGFKSFFLPLSAINLWFISLLLIWYYPIRNKSEVILFASIAFLGFTAEAIGVATGKVFGEYTYGRNLGFKLFEVPVIIGVNWAVLSFATSGLASKIPLKSIHVKAGAASMLMLIFDFFIEQSAPEFDFWEFKLPEVPLQNYITWFILAYIFNFAVLRFITDVDAKICFHVYIVQVLFFTLFYVF
jgi:putative membrane protein